MPSIILIPIRTLLVFRTTKNTDGTFGITSILKQGTQNFVPVEGAENWIAQYNDFASDPTLAGEMSDFLVSADAADAKLGQFFRTLNGGKADMSAYIAFGTQASKTTSVFGGTLAKLGATAKSVLLNFAAFAAATLIFEGLKWVWSLIPTYEHLNEKLEESRAAAEESQQKLDSLNDELKTTRDRIVELQGLGRLSIVEEAELKNLKAQNAELEKELAIQKAINEEKQKDKIVDAFKVARSQTSNFSGEHAYVDAEGNYIGSDKDSAIAYLDALLFNGGLSDKYGLNTGFVDDDYDERQKEYEKEERYLLQLRESILNGKTQSQFVIDEKTPERIQKLKETLDGIEWFDNAKDGTWQADSNKALEFLWDWENAYLISLGEFDAVWNSIFNQSRFDDATEKLTALGDSGELSAEKLAELYQNNDKIKQFIDYLAQIGMLDLTNADKNRNGVLSVEELTSAFGSLSAQLNRVTEDVNKNTYSVSSATAIYTGLKEKVETLSDAYAQLDNNGELTAEMASKLIDTYPDLIDCIETEGNTIKINKDLLAEKIELEKQNRIASVQSSKDAAEAALKEAIAKNEVAKAEFLLYQHRRNMFISGRMEMGDSRSEAERSANEFFVAPDLMDYDISKIESDIKKYEAQLKILNAIDPFDLSKTKKETDSGDKIKAAFEAEYDILKAEKEKMDAGFAWDTSIIADTEDYFNKLGALNDKFFKNDKDHAEEYGKYSLEVLNGRRDLVMENFEAEKRSIELADKAYGTNSLDKKLELYASMKQELHKYAEEYRAMMRAAGISDEWIEKSDYIKTLQDEWWSAEDENIDSVVNEYKRWVDAQKDAIEKSIDYYDHLIDKQKAFIDGEKSLYDAENDIRDIRRDIEKELRTNKALSEYLDEDTRKLLFNEDDYNHLSTVLDGISSEIGSINAWYNSQINSLTEDTWYLEEEITAEYERRLAVEEKKYELARQQLDLEKKKLELNNVLNERNIRMLTKNENGDYEWTYVHDTEKAAEIVGEISDIESEIEDIKVKSAQEASIAEKERLASVYGTINGAAEQRKKELDESVDGLEKVIDEMKSPILEFTDIVTAASKTMNETIKKYFGDNIKIGDYNAIPSKNNSGATGSSSNSSSWRSSSTLSSSSKGSSSDDRTSYSSEEQAIAIEGMRQNSEAWLNTKDANERKQLEKENQRIGKSYGLTYDAASGKWYRDKDKTQLAYTVTKHADGTLFAEKGFSLLNDGAGLEILRTKSGALVDLTGGETVFNNKQTEFLYKLSKSGTFPRLAGNETNTNYNFKGDIVLKDVQNPQDFIRALSKELKQSSFKNK